MICLNDIKDMVEDYEIILSLKSDIILRVNKKEKEVLDNIVMKQFLVNDWGYLDGKYQSSNIKTLECGTGRVFARYCLIDYMCYICAYLWKENDEQHIKILIDVAEN